MVFSDLGGDDSNSSIDPTNNLYIYIYKLNVFNSCIKDFLVSLKLPEFLCLNKYSDS